MPFKSKAQQRFMFAAEERGDVPKGTAERWAKHTPDIKGLPEKKKEKKMKKASAAEIDVFVKAAMDRYAKLGIPQEAAEAMFKAEINKLAEQLGVVESVMTPAEQVVKIACEALVQTGMKPEDAQVAVTNHLMDKAAAEKKAQLKQALSVLVKAANDSKK